MRFGNIGGRHKATKKGVLQEEEFLLTVREEMSADNTTQLLIQKIMTIREGCPWCVPQGGSLVVGSWPSLFNENSAFANVRPSSSWLPLVCSVFSETTLVS